jgi:hypothetical protein
MRLNVRDPQFPEDTTAMALTELTALEDAY